MLEIDLEENLRRRRDELTTKVESLGEGLVGSSNADDLAARKRELKSLKRQSTELEARAKGKDFAELRCSAYRIDTLIL